MTSNRRASREQGGFVLALVVLMLFAISVAGAAGYLLVNTEFSMARHATQSGEALTVARGGLQRFVAEQLGVVGDSVSYAIGNGVALLTSRKLVELDSLNHVYFIRSEGTVGDALNPSTPARRVVGAYAYHRKRPLKHWGAMVVAADAGYSYGSGADVDGDDHNSAGDCAGGGLPSITGIIARVAYGAQAGGEIDGSPDGEAWGGGFSQMYDSVALRWDILSDPNFPVEFDGTPPNFGSLPADSFPVVRKIGPLAPGSSWSGRGVLIVTGKFDPTPSFSWNGIVLAGEIDDINQGDVRGMVIGGLSNEPGQQSPVYWYNTVRYHSCYVHAANESLSYLELIENSEFEVF